MTYLLFLARILILNHCLSVPNCQKTFSSARWAILQVCPYLFRDVFQDLFQELSENLRSRTISGLELRDIVRKEFLSVRGRLVDLNFPNFTKQSKLRLVIDEAQILGDDWKLFESSAISKRRPILSPVIHGIRDTGRPAELTIIYCGTGLSIRTLYCARTSRDILKESGTGFPMLKFPGWTDQASIQLFIDRVKDQLPDNESKKAMEDLIPEEAVKMLHQKLTGRFRYICTAIGKILMGIPG
ncbi:hypothetical protein BGZ76_007088, partial [Entomortierella beljakovae]